MHTLNRNRRDVVIVGGRAAGSAAAMLLARLGHDVVVVDRASFPSDTVSTHSIARSGVVQLRRWGLLDAVLDSGAPAIRKLVACCRCVPANLAVQSSECFAVAPGDATIPWLGCSGSSVARAVADVRGRAVAGVAAGSPMWVEEGDRQFRALDVGVMTEARERDRRDAQPG
jgi:glycine/D-amino acid oxidase-like deaminating enzyme